MDSKPKITIGIPQAEMPPIRFDEGRVRRTNRWLVAAVAALALLVVALGVALIASSDEGTAPPPGQGAAPTKIVQAIDANVAALNAGDAGAYAATWAEDAVFTGGGLETAGVDEIVAAAAQRPNPDDWRLERTSEVVFVPRLSRGSVGGWVYEPGPYAAHSFTCVNGADPAYTYSGIAVYQFGEGSKILHQWVMSPGRKWVRGCY